MLSAAAPAWALRVASVSGIMGTGPACAIFPPCELAAPPTVVGPIVDEGPDIPLGIAATGVTTGDVVLGISRGSSPQYNSSLIFMLLFMAFVV